MLPEEFKPHIDALVGVFNPRGWDAITETAYYGVVRRWTESELVHVCNIAVQRHEYMPKPKHLIAIYNDLNKKAIDRGDDGFNDDCNCCHGGLIPITAVREGIEYERVCACECDAGKRRWSMKYGGRRMRSYRELFDTPPPQMQEPDAQPNPVFERSVSKKMIQRTLGVTSLKDYLDETGVQAEIQKGSNDEDDWPDPKDLPF